MQKIIVSALLTFSFSYAFGAKTNFKKELNLKVEDFILDEKKSKGEICKNIDTPEWEKDETSGEETLRFGPHIYFNHINDEKIVDNDSDPNCIFEFKTTLKDQQIIKNINQKCKDAKQSSEIIQKVEFKNNEITISYLQSQNKKETKALCYLKMAKGAK